MYKNTAIISLSVIVLILFGLVIRKHPSPKPTTETVVITHIDTVVQVKDTTIYKKGKDIRHDSIIYVEVPVDRKIDTAAILKDYFAKVVYRDTLKF